MKEVSNAVSFAALDNAHDGQLTQEELLAGPQVQMQNCGMGQGRSKEAGMGNWKGERLRCRHRDVTHIMT